MKKIVIDAFGGDNAPEQIVQGGVLALASQSDFNIVLVGNKEKIENILGKLTYDKSRVEILEANEVITNDDIPTDAIRGKKDSTIVVGMEHYKKDEDMVGFISAGSTGAVLAGAIFKIGRIRGINRPALAPVMPTITDGKVMMLDIGANVDCKPEFLCQFALMGSAYMSNALKVANPRVALLSNGTEDKKGNAFNKEVFVMLKELKGINFVGNMEARDILSGDFDVIVTDGFAGNIALKSSEGAVNAVMKMLKKEIMSSFTSKIGAIFMKKSFKNLKNKMDYSKVGGASLLGIDKVVVKCHGASNAETIKCACVQAFDLYESKYIDSIKKSLEDNK